MWLEERKRVWGWGGQDVKEGTEIPRFHKNFRKQLFPNPLHCPGRSTNLHKSWEVITKPELPQPQVISSPALMGLCIKAPWSWALAEPRAAAQITQNPWLNFLPRGP